MNKSIIPMTDAYREHFYPKGFYGSLVSPGGGIAIVVCGLVLGLIVFLPGMAAYDIFLDYLEGESDFGTLLFMVLVALAFLAGGVLVIKVGIKKIRMKADDYVKKSAGVSGYPESVIHMVDAQIVASDTLRLELAGENAVSGKGFLTREFLVSGNALDLTVIKIEDIAKAYYTTLPHPTARHAYCLWLMVWSNRKTLVALEVKRKEEGDELVSMLLERNPAIDTYSGAILKSKEHDAIIKEMR